MLRAIQNDKYGPGSIDFNKIIPLPAALNIESGTRTEKGLRAYQEYLKEEISEQEFINRRSDISSEEWELGKQAYANLVNYGAPTWYEWSVRHWGSKWNAYGMVCDAPENTLGFQTAWSPPHLILERLSKMYPSVTFTHEWADENIGANCGKRVYANGEILEEYIPKGVRAMEFAHSIWNYDPTDNISFTEDSSPNFIGKEITF